MNEISDNNKHILLYTLKWMSLYIAIGFLAALLLPFPASLIGAIGGFMLVNFLRTREKEGDKYERTIWFAAFVRPKPCVHVWI